MTRALVTQLMSALDYHQFHTRPMQYSKDAIKAAREYLAQSVEPEVLMVDAAMAEMKNIVPPLRRSECLRLIRAAINATAHPPQPQATTPVPEGYVLVPIEPTPLMLDALQHSLERIDSDRQIYQAMVKAAQGEKP